VQQRTLKNADFQVPKTSQIKPMIFWWSLLIERWHVCVNLPTVTYWKSRKMLWTVRCFFLFAGFFMDRVSAGKQCREERSINGMALQGFILKKFFARALHECDISCETEITCQSYNYVLGEKSCELNNRTKEARPEHFRSDPARFYKRRLSNRGMCEKT